MDYFVWFMRDAATIMVIDTGFTEPVATRRGREFLHCPIDILAALVATDAVKDILTHLHYDHLGILIGLPMPAFISGKELQFATGKGYDTAHVLFI